MAAGVATVVAPIAIEAIKTKSVAPITNNAMNIDTVKTGVARAAGGYALGFVGGKIIDKTGLKKPVNKLLRMVKVI